MYIYIDLNESSHGLNATGEAWQHFPHTGNVLGDLQEIHRSTEGMLGIYFVLSDSARLAINVARLTKLFARLSIPDNDWPAKPYIGTDA